MKVADALAELHTVAQQLREQFPDLDSDDAAWMGTLEGCTSAVDLAEHLAEGAIYLVSLQSAALDRAKQLQARAKRFEAEEDRLRAILLAMVDAAGGKKMVFSGCTLSPRNVAPKVVAVDPDATPADYLITITTQQPDKRAIRDALELGVPVEGWMRSNGGRSLSILVR